MRKKGTYIGNILIACECSGRVRDAFENLGWNAHSIDLLPTESEQTKKSGKHFQGDIFNHKETPVTSFLYRNFYDMCIAFPPCTFLSYAGTAHWNKQGRIEKRLQALDFFRKLWELPVEHICIENPKGCASPVIAKYSQIIQPYYFGEPYYKTTCLWLKNLPLLTYSSNDNLFQKKTAVKPTLYHVNSGSIYTAKYKDVVYKGSSNSKERAKTFTGIANAMAEQWTEYFLNI